MLVNVIRRYNFPDFYRQSPQGLGVWKGIDFKLNSTEEYDLLVCLNPPSNPVKEKGTLSPRWLLTQEPPIPSYSWHQTAFAAFDRVFTQHAAPEYPMLVPTQTCLPWHVQKNYNELCQLEPGNKSGNISSITSNYYELEGHRKRWDFLQYLKREGLEIELYGKGFRFLTDKFAGLYPFRYSVAIENASYPDYWTEKIADCFLSWTMPIYAGCPNIIEYFPQEAMIIIDLADHERSKALIEEAVRKNLWQKNLDAIAAARTLVLEQYQFFPFMHAMIQQYYDSDSKNRPGLNSPLPYFPETLPGLGKRIKSFCKKIIKPGHNGR